ncbi:MAG: acyl-CoA dehydrogenase [Gammaproteobacteria bacterium]|nr:acyl-CoA dehydrogenase [Gammaproteobacteria bacterium]
MDFALSEDQVAFRDAARTFADAEFAPHAATWDKDKTFPRATIARAGELGFCGLYTPEALGGMGLPRLDSAIVLEALAGGCTSTTAFISIHNMATWMVAEFGAADVFAPLVAELAAGRALASYCLTEPGAGSDAGSLVTRAERDGDSYVINGGKTFISGAGATDVLVLMARTAATGNKGISTFVVPADADGISYGGNLEKLGWHSQPTREVRFDDVSVDATRRLGDEGDGFRIAMRGLDGGRINIAACSVGTADAAIEAARTHMGERRQFGQALAEFQALQFKLADMVTNLTASRQMVHLAASMLDAGDPDAATYCAMAKRFATDACFDICNHALQLHGGYGYMEEYPLERFVRDTRVHQILEGTNEIMRLIIARRLLADGARRLGG